MCTSPFKIKQGYKWIDVPCGSCDECKLQYRKMWTIRLSYEKRYHKKSCFVTLTYADEHLPEGSTLVKEDLQLYMKRLRKRLGSKKVRYFAAGEYGGEHERPHYHVILFGIDDKCPDFYEKKWNAGHQGYDCKSYSWPFGRVSVDPVTEASLGYVAGYTTKKVKDKKDWYKEKGILPEFVLMSRKPGIGEQYLRDNWNRLKKNGFIKKRGLDYALPRYYEDKMYSTEEEKAERHQMKVQKIRQDEIQMREYCRKYKLDYYQYKADVLAQREKNLKARMSLKKEGDLNV